MIQLRPASRDDAALVAEFIRELAVYEKLEHACHVTPEAISTSLFGPRPYAEVTIAELDQSPVGFALYFHNYSTFLAKPGLYLEDLFVRPHARGRGVGKALLAHLARLAVERGCGRVEWSVLDWNTPAIDFYRGLGATPMEEWTTFRLTGDALRQLSERD
jgi:GNAT superfamily N-acetyltransferase